MPSTLHHSSMHDRVRPSVERLEDRSVPATFTVTTNADAGLGSLRDAIAQANALPGQDRIEFARSVVGVDLFTGPLVITDGVDIVGYSDQDLTIRGNNQEANFRISLATSLETVSFSDMRLANNGSASGNGAAIINENGSVLLTRMQVNGTAIGDGGGVYQTGGSLRAIDSRFLSGTAARGGGVFIAGGAFLLERSSFLFCNATSGRGGAVFVAGGSGTIRMCTFAQNTSLNSDGGALAIDVSGVAIEDSLFIDNTANGVGGALDLRASATIRNSVISGNVAFGGGGIFASTSGAVTLEGCTISENEAIGSASGEDLGGGGILSQGAPLVLRNVTVSGNTAAAEAGYGGGGIGVLGGSATITNSTIAFNSLTGGGMGGGLFGTGAPGTGSLDLFNTVVAGNGGGTDIAAGGSAVINARYSIVQNPGSALNGTAVSVQTGVDPQLEPLADNGGFVAGASPNQSGLSSPQVVRTHALRAGSPAVNSGDNSLAVGLDFDGRGAGFPRIDQGNVDIGAFELIVPSVPIVPEPQTFAARVAVGGASQAVTYRGDGTEQSRFDPFPGFSGGVRVATADVNGDGIPDTIASPGPGGGPIVKVFDGRSGRELASFEVFEASFTGGVWVAGGDVDADGFADVVATAGRSGAPVVAIFSGAHLSRGSVGVGAELVRFMGINDAAFFGGVRPAVGDVNGDGFADVIVAAGFGGGPRVAIWDGKALAGGSVANALLANFFAFEPTLRNGCYVAVGDVTGDGQVDLIFGRGDGDFPLVRIADARPFLAAGPNTGDAPIGSNFTEFFAGDPSTRSGVRISVADMDGDGVGDIVTGTGSGPATVITYAGASIRVGTPPPVQLELEPFPGSDTGVFVG